MSALVFAYPGDLDAPTGGYGYDRRMIAELRDLGWTVRRLPLPAGFPFPSEAELVRTEAAFAEVEDGALVLVDGLAFGAMPDIARRHGGRLRLVALVHHPLALETGLTDVQAAAFAASERASLAETRAVVATSAMTARQLAADYAVAPDRLTVAVPGTDPGEAAPGAGEPPRLLCVASLTPRKAHEVLIEALVGLKDIAWSCRLAGSLDLSPETAASVRDAVQAVGLDDRIEIVGATADVRALMVDADLFVLPSRHEGYGMAFAEALSHGLPVVGCAAGAVPDVVPPDAGVLVPVDDVTALRQALRTLLTDPVRRRALADGARRAGAALPTWARSAATLATALELALEMA